MTAYTDQNTALSRTPSTLVVVKLDRCQESHGDSPCTASGTPCFNTYETCQDRDNYNPAAHEYKFCLNQAPAALPGEIVRPYVVDVSRDAQEIRLDESLLVNERVTITMLDEPDSDIGIDPYRVSATSRSSTGGSDSIATAGTFWRKLRARNPHYKNRRVLVKQGFVADGFGDSDYETDFEGVLDDIKVGTDGRVQLVVKGLLQLTDVDYPRKTDGELRYLLPAATTSTFDLAPWSGVDRYASQPLTTYDTPGYLYIDGEIVRYLVRNIDTDTGVTTFETLTRGALNAYGYDAATDHSADTAVQQAIFLQDNPIDLIKDLLNQAGISNADIDTTSFDDEKSNWFQGVTFSAVLYEPVKIKKLIHELREQTGTYIWQGDDNLIKIKSIAPNLAGVSYQRITDADNILYKSRAVDDNEAGRFTRTVVWYDIRAGQKADDTENFRRAAVVVDADAESADQYNEQKDREPIFSRFINSVDTGADYARIAASRIVRRFRNGAQIVTFHIDPRDDDTLALGDIFELLSDSATDYDGNPTVVKYICTKKRRSGHRIEVTAYKTQLTGRPAYIAPDSVTAPYTSASDADQDYCYIASGTPASPGGGDNPYTII